MMKFNKSLLTAAVVGALALPGLASAATLSYATGKQITYAKDLIVNDGTTITTPDQLQLRASSANDVANVNAITAGDQMRVKVTLTNGAKFDSNADVTALVSAFNEGAQTGGAGAITIPSGNTPYYSATGQELNFVYTTTGNGAGANAGYFLELNSMQITNLVQGLAVGDSVGVEITVQNASNVQILATSTTLVKSKWGLVTAKINSSETTKKIDVGSTPMPKSWFSPTGAVGASMLTPVDPERGFYHLGGITIDVASDAVTGGGTAYVNNYNSAAPFNVVGTAEFKIRLTGAGLAAYGNNIQFATDGNCAGMTGTAAPAADGSITVTLPASSPLLANVTAASPSATNLHVCAKADGTYELGKVDSITGEVSVDYKLPTQRKNPALDPVNFGAIDFNGTELVFQNVNPAGNPTAQSFLRLTNNNATTCAVEIDAKDDAGMYVASPVTFTLAAHKSVQINSEDLENGNATKTPAITGGFGDGAGKWYVRVTAQCTNFKASALNRNAQTGTVTDLTPEKQNGAEWSVNKNNHL